MPAEPATIGAGSRAMVALTQTDLDLLSAIHAKGGKLHIVTHQDRMPDKYAIGLLMWAYRMCDEDCMRVVRNGGDKNKPGGEAFVDLVLTKRAERAVAKG